MRYGERIFAHTKKKNATALREDTPAHRLSSALHFIQMQVNLLQRFS